MATLPIPVNDDLLTHPWFALRVRSNFERETDRMLHGKGYPSFYPFYKVKRQWSDRVKELDLPLFPGYVFCRFDPHRRLPVLTVPGVLSVVGMGKTPIPIEEAEIQSIQRLMESGRGVTPWPYLKEGQRIRITHGPMKGVEGRLIRMKGTDTLVASITLLQRSVATVLDRDLVEPVL